MFDAVLMIDWSAGNDRGPKPCADAIWASLAHDGKAGAPIYLRNRQLAETAIIDIIESEIAKGHRLLVGFDLCLAYPAGFADALTGTDDPFAVWKWFADRVEDSPKANNRFALAGQINALFPGIGPFWFNGSKADVPHLPRKGTDRTGHGLPEKRETDGTAFSPWQLGGVGAVGSQVIMGMPTLHRLRERFGKALSVWPFEKPETQVVLAETYFSLLPGALDLQTHAIKDAAQAALYAERFSALDAASWAAILDRPATPEGWVLGLGQEHLLGAQRLTPPPLKNDCFAMPQGAHWTPVDTALAHLKTHLAPVTEVTTCATQDALGRVLATDAVAVRSHPPKPNSAVDGYAFAGPAPAGVQHMPRVSGRAAAGVPFEGQVPAGHAVRILTGASLPEGTDTVILQEDVSASEAEIAFHGPLKKGANARRSGEDMTAGTPVLTEGRKLQPADLATLTAAGVAEVAVRKRLRVGVLSTGDELADPGSGDADRIFDANRPMLLADIARWGFEPVDLGRAPDDRATLAEILTGAAAKCDVILTSGGASGGDEDHISALLQDTGAFALWRVAVKPGRPLVFGLWDGVPVIGLPGNPVAAQVCTLIFARPALHVLAGAGWTTPEVFMVPAAFTKSKKAGRREYLRARITPDGAAEVFASEGSGRVSGLSWATGLVELGDDALNINAGDLVRFLPFSGFGL